MKFFMMDEENRLAMQASMGILKNITLDTQKNNGALHVELESLGSSSARSEAISEEMKNHFFIFNPSVSTFKLDDREERKLLQEKMAFDIRASSKSTISEKKTQKYSDNEDHSSTENISRWLKDRHSQNALEEQEDSTALSDYDKDMAKLKETVLPCDKPWRLTSSISSMQSVDGEKADDGVERTLVIIKPCAMPYKNVILRTVLDHGFQIVNQRVVHLSPEQASELYAQYYGSPSFAYLITSISDKPVLVLSLAAVNAIQKWQNIIGLQDSVRREWFFPLSARIEHWKIIETIPSAIATSFNRRIAKSENRYFFPDSILEPIKCELDVVTDYCSKYINKTLSAGLKELLLKRPKDPILFLADWLIDNNPFVPKISCSSKTCLRGNLQNFSELPKNAGVSFREFSSEINLFNQ